MKLKSVMNEIFPFKVQLDFDWTNFENSFFLKNVSKF